MRLFIKCVALVATLLLLSDFCLCKKPTSHPHQGKMEPYKPGSFGLKLDDDDIKKLKKGGSGELKLSALRPALTPLHFTDIRCL